MRKRSYMRFRGMSLIELLIVLSIISLLLQLVLPAVQSAREAARRTQCFNNMRQLGLAMQQYESAHKLLPPGWIREPKVDHNFIQFLLPYIDKSIIYDKYDFAVSWKDPKNEPLTRVEIPIARCPTAPAEQPFISDYAIYMSVEDKFFQKLVEAKMLYKRENTDGALIGKPVRSSRITDGLSKTIFLCEDGGRPNKYWFGGRLVKGTVTGSRWATPVGRFQIDERCNGTRFHKGTRLFNCTNNNEIFSFHPEGANFLFGDASVQYVLDDIEPDVLVSMLTARAGD